MKSINNKVAVLGFGIEGQDVTKYLVDNDIKVDIYDIREIDIEIKEKFPDANFITGESYLDKGLMNYDIIYRSPGVYRYISQIVEAENHGVEISSPMKLFFDLCPAKIIGVTGTKGKGTTSTLIYEILKASGFDVHLAGNIGKPFIELLPLLTPSSWVILEMSSFQLIDMHKSPHMSVVLNITTDHLDWHKDRNEYLDAKKSIVKFQTTDDLAVVNNDYEDSNNFSNLTKASVYKFSCIKKVKGSYVSEDKIWLNIKELEKVGDVDKLILRGKHNWENICAAICASSLVGVKTQIIRDVVFSFKGLEHRLEYVREVKGIKFYNDSFGTGPDTAIAALNSFHEPVTIILGGFDKHLDYTELSKYMSDRQNTNAVLIGDIGTRIEVDLKKAKFSGKFVNAGKSSMVDVVSTAIMLTPRGGVVVLSPATSSFDMFPNYKERGIQFKKAVSDLTD